MYEVSADIIALCVGALIVLVVMGCRELNLKDLDKTAMSLINSAKEFMYGKGGQTLKEKDPELYSKCMNALRDMEYLLTSEDLSLIKCLRAIVDYSDLFEEAREEFRALESLKK